MIICNDYTLQCHPPPSGIGWWEFHPMISLHILLLITHIQCFPLYHIKANPIISSCPWYCCAVEFKEFSNHKIKIKKYWLHSPLCIIHETFEICASIHCDIVCLVFGAHITSWCIPFCPWVLQVVKKWFHTIHHPFWCNPLTTMHNTFDLICTTCTCKSSWCIPIYNWSCIL